MKIRCDEGNRAAMIKALKEAKELVATDSSVKYVTIELTCENVELRSQKAAMIRALRKADDYDRDWLEMEISINSEIGDINRKIYDSQRISFDVEYSMYDKDKIVVSGDYYENGESLQEVKFDTKVDDLIEFYEAQEEDLIVELEPKEKVWLTVEPRCYYEDYDYDYDPVGWHPSDSGLTPDMCTDDEREVYYGL